MGLFGLFALRVEFEIGLVFGDGFVFFLHLLRDLSQGEVGGGVVGLNADSILGAEVGALIVFVAQIELCDGEIFIDALVVGLNPFDLGKFAMNGGAFGRIRRIAFCGWVVGSGVGIVATGTGARTAAGVVAGEFRRRLRGEWMLGRGIGGCGCCRAWRVGRIGRLGWFGRFAGKGELLGGGWLLCGRRRRGAGFGCLIGGLVGGRAGCRGWVLSWCSLRKAGRGEEEGQLQRSGYGMNCHLV